MTPIAEVTKLIPRIDANVKRLHNITDGLSDAAFHWRPEAGSWSIAECIAHLNVVDGGDIEAICGTLSMAQAEDIRGSKTYNYGYFATKFVTAMRPPIGRKFKAPKAYLPPANAPLDATIATFQRNCTDLRKLVNDAVGLGLAGVKCQLSALPAALRPWIKMSLGARFDLLVTHDERHLWQAEQVRKHPGFPAA